MKKFMHDDFDETAQEELFYNDRVKSFVVYLLKIICLIILMGFFLLMLNIKVEEFLDLHQISFGGKKKYTTNQPTCVWLVDKVWNNTLQKKDGNSSGKPLIVAKYLCAVIYEPFYEVHYT